MKSSQVGFCFLSVSFQWINSGHAYQWVTPHRCMTWLCYSQLNVDELPERVYVWMRLLASNVPRSHYCSQSLLLAPDSRSAASSDGSASKHVGEVLFKSGRHKSLSCVCVRPSGRSHGNTGSRSLQRERDPNIRQSRSFFFFLFHLDIRKPVHTSQPESTVVLGRLFWCGDPEDLWKSCSCILCHQFCDLSHVMSCFV